MIRVKDLINFLEKIDQDAIVMIPKGTEQELLTDALMGSITYKTYNNLPIESF